MAKKATVRVPNLDNATPGMLIDEIGVVREQMSSLKKTEGFLKQALTARLEEGQTIVEGDNTHDGLIENTVQERLDTPKIREDMDDEWIRDHTKVLEYKTIRTTRKG
jgi:hypothetical protein